MPINDVLLALRQRPFVPFRVHVTDGSSYEVRHPEMLMPGARSVIIGLTVPNQLPPVYESWVIVDLIHITRLEPLPIPATPNGQGS